MSERLQQILVDALEHALEHLTNLDAVYHARAALGDVALEAKGGNVVALRPSSTVDVLRAALSRAEAGELVGVAIVQAHRDGVDLEWAGDAEYHKLNSGAARLAHKLAAIEDWPS